MANQFLDQLVGLLQGLKQDTANLNRDLDEKDQREETKVDLSRIFKSFAELRALMSKLDKAETAKLQEELRQLMSGEESILEYNNDVNKILMEVKKRTESKEVIKDKVIENMPADQKRENVGSLFDNWQSALNNVHDWLEKNSSVGSR